MGWRDVLISTEGNPYTVPQYLLEGMSKLSPNLKLRWSWMRERWCVEEVIKRVPLNPSRHIPPYVRLRGVRRLVANDIFSRANSGTSLLGYWSAQPRLSDWCLRNLEYYNMENWSARKMIQEVERGEKVKEDSILLEHNDQQKDMALDMYSTLAWGGGGGSRTSVPRSYDNGSN